MRKELPARPSLEHLKSQAKDLLSALQRAEPEALARVRAGLPAAKSQTDVAMAARLALHDAQSVVAREYGFASWAALRTHIDSLLPPETTAALSSQHPAAPLPDAVQQALLSIAANARPEQLALPSRLPVLPLRNALLAAGSVAPLQVGRASSLESLRVAQVGNGQLAVFSQKDANLTDPTEPDLHPVGCSVLVKATVPFDGGQWVVVQALQWIRLVAIETTGPCVLARVTPFAVRQEAGEEVRAREQTLRDRLRLRVAALPEGDRILRLTERMTPLELADATIANLPCSVDDKAHYAAEPSLTARLDFVIGLLDRAE